MRILAALLLAAALVHGPPALGMPLHGGPAPRRTAIDPTAVKRVHLIQANHLDLGFSDLLTKVVPPRAPAPSSTTMITTDIYTIVISLARERSPPQIQPRPPGVGPPARPGGSPHE